VNGRGTGPMGPPWFKRYNKQNMGNLIISSLI